MRSVSLLDCTLRDGGYINDWGFGKGTALAIINRLVDAGIDYIEIGFLDDRRPFDINKTIQPDTKSITKIFSEVNKNNSKIVAMIDYGTCDIANIQEKEETNIDAIRLIFKKEKIEGAIPFAKQLQSKGYDVFLQLVSITAYSDKDLLYLIDRANEIHPFAVSIVDTYGLLHKEELLHYYELLDRNLDKKIIVGYHSHNNFQLGYSNSIAFLEHKSNRNILVDGTLYGMGKSAGNAPLELLAMHLNNEYDKHYKIASLLEAIDNNLMNIYRKKPWGYSYIYYISAVNDCHPNYVSYLLDKNTLSVHSIFDILSTIPEDKKLHFDNELIESLYVQYQSKYIDDSHDLSEMKSIFNGNDVLLLGPGKTLYQYKDKINDYIKRVKPLVVSINTDPSEYDYDYIFLTSSKRYDFDYGTLSKQHNCIIATSNVSAVDGNFKYVINYERISSTLKTEEKDNSLIILIQLLNNYSPKSIMLAGFDGFTGIQDEDYYDSRIALNVIKSADAINNNTKKYISRMKNKIKIDFITPSKYSD